MLSHVRISKSYKGVNYTYGSTIDNTAYVIGQIPLMTLQTKAKMYASLFKCNLPFRSTNLFSAPFLLPSLQISWAIIAFCQSQVTKNWHLYLLRALTGFLEASSFGGTHLIREFTRPYFNSALPKVSLAVIECMC